MTKHPKTAGTRRAMFKTLSLAAALCLPALLPTEALADAAADYPNQAIRIVVPNPAGGTSDVIARLLAKELHESWGQSVVVDNRAGGNGHIGAGGVARSKPDGYSLLLLDMSVLTLASSVMPSLNYDPMKDLAPISIAAYSPHLLVVRQDMPVSNLQELAAYAKEKGEPISFGTPLAAISQLAGLQIAESLGFEFNVIGYKGGAQVMQDLAGSQVDSGMASVIATYPLVQSGKIKALAVTSAQPFATTPGIPTVAQDIPQFVSGSWQGLLAPAGTPEPILAKLEAEIQRILAKPEVLAKLRELGSEPVPMPRADIGKWMSDEESRWGEVVKKHNVTSN